MIHVTTLSGIQFPASGLRAKERKDLAGLCERMRPRDLYDVVLLGAITRSDVDAQALRAVAVEKFAVKGMTLPAVAARSDSICGRQPSPR